MRELREELDVLAEDFIHMGTVSPENSILNAHVHLYLAHHLVFNSRQDSYTLSLFARATLLGYL